MKKLTALFVMLTLINCSLNATELSVDTIISKMVTTYGGEENLKKLNSYTQIWDIESKVKDVNGTDTRMVILPTSLKTDIEYPNKKEIRVLHNGYGSKTTNKQRVVVEGPMLLAMKLQLMRLYTPLTLKKNSADIKLIEQKEHYVLQLSKDDVASQYFVSKKSFLIDQVIGQLKMQGSTMQFLTMYRHYIKVDGALTPQMEIKFAAGTNTAIMRLREMNIVPAIKK